MQSRFSLPFALGLLSALLVPACHDAAVVGIDRCASGDAAACEAPPSYQDYLPNNATEIKLHTGDAPSLDPTWERTLPVADAVFKGSVLVGNGKAGLWYLKVLEDRTTFEVYQLDEGDEGDSAARVLDSMRIDPPTNDDFPASYNNGAALGPVTLTGLRLSDRLARAPALTASWRFPCRGLDGGSMCGGDEVVVLSPDLSAAPMRVFPPLNTLPSALRTQDGGAWMFSVGFLARYDATGRQLRLVDEFAQASPAEFTISGANYGVDWPQMALAPSDEPILIVGEKGLIKIWHLDDQGQVLLRAGFGDAKTYPVVDRSGRAVLLTMTLGDLSVRRVELEPEAKIVSQHTAMRDDYTDLVIDNVTEDLAGNLYVLTGTGPRGASVATVCKLPLKGDLSCYLLPAMHGRMIVGGDKNVLYAATRTTNDVAETLQRYDLP